MSQEIIIRTARPDELEWINSQYDEVGFKHSDFENELIAIAEIERQRAGLGRLQQIEESVAELGGIYVGQNHRGMGIARLIVGFLIENAETYPQIYCLPFSNLKEFYGNFGFSTVGDFSKVPKQIIEKHAWCNSTYTEKVLLLGLNTNGEKI